MKYYKINATFLENKYSKRKGLCFIQRRKYVDVINEYTSLIEFDS